MLCLISLLLAISLCLHWQQSILQRDHEDLQANDLIQMLAGSLIELSRHQTKLVGGHTSIAEYAGLGFAVTGMAAKPQAQVEPDKASGMTFDLLLTKPLGTGVILAAEMRQLCPADSYEGAVSSDVAVKFSGRTNHCPIPAGCDDRCNRLWTCQTCFEFNTEGQCNWCNPFFPKPVPLSLAHYPYLQKVCNPARSQQISLA